MVWGYTWDVYPRYGFVIVGPSAAVTRLATSASSIRTQNGTTFVKFTVAFSLPFSLDLRTIVAFLQFLPKNHISPRVINNYLSSLRSKARNFNLPVVALDHISVSLFIKKISNNSRFKPLFRGYFDIQTIRNTYIQCQHSSDPQLYRAIFLTSFYAFLHMSNIAPHSRATFSPHKHLLRKDVIFTPPGTWLLVKWAKICKQLHSIGLSKFLKWKTVGCVLSRLLRDFLNRNPFPYPNPCLQKMHSLIFRSLILRLGMYQRIL